MNRPAPAEGGTRLGGDERFLAEGSFVLLEFIAAGDGTYRHPGGGVFAMGSPGFVMGAMAFSGALAMGQAVGERPAQRQWRQISARALIAGPCSARYALRAEAARRWALPRPVPRWGVRRPPAPNHEPAHWRSAQL